MSEDADGSSGAPFGAYLAALLERHGVQHVFGIPGVHTAELYRGLAGSGIRHVTPRHEQGAGFMADGYARTTGRPGVCFVITGPGLTNIATAMAQAYGDSIPMLVISGVAAAGDLGRPHGGLHELPDQQGLASKLAAFSHTLRDPAELPDVLARAFALFTTERPRPVHIEVPLDVMERRMPATTVVGPRPSAAAEADPTALADIVDLVERATAPLILAGGGARAASATVTALAERIDAPVVMTVNGRGIVPLGHRLAVPASPSLDAVRALVAAADVVVAVGTELGRTDYDIYARGGFAVPGALVRIDIDPQSPAVREPDIAVYGDAGAVIDALLERMAGPESPDRGGAERARAARHAAGAELAPAALRHVALLHAIRDALPDCTIVGDSTGPVYAGNLFFEARAPNRWFNSATGYGTLGYALPAAIGAKLGAPDRPVVCLAGDGGLQFTLGEFGSAVDAGAPVIALVWNNRGYGEIKSYMEERGIPPLGVDLATPDFCAVARAYGWAAECLSEAEALPVLLAEAADRAAPTLIEIDATALS